MPANNRSSAQSQVPPPTSPSGKNIAKYTNKDGSKYIAVPKATSSAQTIETQPNMPTKPAMPTPQSSVLSANNGPPAGVNHKKQKRRQKMAAKAAAAAGNGHPSMSAATTASSTAPAVEASSSADRLIPEHDADADSSTRAVHGSSAASVASQNGAHDLGEPSPADTLSKSKKSKKKKKKKHSEPEGAEAAAEMEPQPGPSSYRPVQHQVARSDDRFWNTNSQEERQRIKDFWLSLGEEERRNLVRLEKETILRKMKEQQRNTCSCAVCGRKRTAIEQELESLYESYYKELENYANRAEGAMASPTSFALRAPRSSQPLSYHHHHHHHHHGDDAGHGHGHATSRIVEHVNDDDDDDDDDDDESYADEEYDEEFSDDDDLSDDGGPHDTVEAEFLDFGASLTVKGGILTVADDLLKNDGKKFIEMMEQLAERRMAREEPPSHYGRPSAHGQNGSYPAPHDGHGHGHAHNHGHNHVHPGHNHAHAHAHAHGHSHSHSHEVDPDHPGLHDDLDGHPDDDIDYDDEEEDDDDYDDSQEDGYEEDDDAEGTMTDQQRMEEGRRMFQIFAARMFEQRVLSAYKKNLANERSNKLIQEVEDERRQEELRQQQRAKQRERKREKERLKKEAQKEAKAKKEAEKKQAEEEARKAAEAKRALEQKKAEEKRRLKEEQKRKEEEDRQRKETARLQRIQEQERKKREVKEAKEREKKLKDEQRLKEAREAREKREREHKEREERDRERKEREKQEAAAERDKKAKAAKETKAKAEAEVREQKQAAAKSKAPVQAAIIPKAPAAAKRQQPTKFGNGKQQSSHSQQAPPITTSQPQENHGNSTPASSAPSGAPTHPAAAVAASASAAVQSSFASFASPKMPGATPVIPPKALSTTTTHPIRSRASSQQLQQQPPQPEAHVLGVSTSQQGSGPSHTTSPNSSTPVHSSPGPVLPPANHLMGAGVAGTTPPQGFSLGRDALGMPAPPPGFQGPPPGFHAPAMFPTGRGGFGAFAPDMVSAPPGLNPIARGFTQPPPGFPQPPVEVPLGATPPGFELPPHLQGPPHQHRQLSGGLESMIGGPLPSHLISRPAPIGRPGSVVHGQGGSSRRVDAQEEENEHLGSGALEGAPEDPIGLGQASIRQRTLAPGQGMRSQFPPPAPFDGTFPGFPGQWGPSMAFNATTPGLGSSPWPSAQPGPPPFAAPGVAVASSRGRQQTNQLRDALRRAYLAEVELSNASPEGYADFSSLFHKMTQSMPMPMRVTEQSLIEISETEGNKDNGGGTFETRSSNGRCVIRWEAGAADAGQHHPLGAPGQIGSPVIGSGAPPRGP